VSLTTMHYIPYQRRSRIYLVVLYPSVSALVHVLPLRPHACVPMCYSRALHGLQDKVSFISSLKLFAVPRSTSSVGHVCHHSAFQLCGDEGADGAEIFL